MILKVIRLTLICDNILTWHQIRAATTAQDWSQHSGDHMVSTGSVYHVLDTIIWSPQQSYQVGTIVILVLQKGKWRYKRLSDSPQIIPEATSVLFGESWWDPAGIFIKEHIPSSVYERAPERTDVWLVGRHRVGSVEWGGVENTLLLH